MWKKLSELITTRDDITSYLIKNGYDKESTFGISERVRKGKGLTNEQYNDMLRKGIPKWYMDSCNTVKYLFTRAHVATYALFAYRIAYYKAHFPQEFYNVYFSMNEMEF